jgi:hypothetical protein
VSLSNHASDLSGKAQSCISFRTENLTFSQMSVAFCHPKQIAAVLKVPNISPYYRGSFSRSLQKYSSTYHKWISTSRTTN